jgi:hypothetical protein
MTKKNLMRKKPKRADAELAVAVLDGNPNPVDQDMSMVDPDPTCLDLPGENDGRFKGGTCSNPRCRRPATEKCARCGSPVCRHCAGHGRSGMKA